MLRRKNRVLDEHVIKILFSGEIKANKLLLGLVSEVFRPSSLGNCLSQARKDAKYI